MLVYGQGRRRRSVQRALARVLDPRLRDVFFDCRVVSANLLLKDPAPAPSEVPPHQDLSVVDERRGLDALTVWVPLVDVDRDSGGLGLVPRTHRVPAYFRAHDDPSPFRGFFESLSRDLMIVPKLRAGTAVVALARTVHGSPGNRTDRARPAAVWVVVPRRARLIRYVRLSPTRVAVYRLEDDELDRLAPNEHPPERCRAGEIEHEVVEVTRSEFERIARSG